MSNTDSIGNSAETVSNPVLQNPLIDSVQAGTAANIAAFLEFLASSEAIEPGLMLSLSASSSLSDSSSRAALIDGASSKYAPQCVFDASCIYFWACLSFTASRSRIMGLILSGRESEIAPEGDFDELASKAGISPEQRKRFQRALDEAIDYHQTSESAVEVRP